MWFYHVGTQRWTFCDAVLPRRHPEVDRNVDTEMTARSRL
jgi:hypothetical protein